jgi:hypothetical protein
MKTRIKICGLTRIDDLQQAVQAGADALGLVFYPPSPRYVDLSTAARLARAVPPFVSIVGLFVNADPATVRATLAAVPIHLLQLHGDEDEAYCQQFDRPYIKAARVRPGMDLLQYAAAFPSAQARRERGHFGPYGGVFVAETLMPALAELREAYAACQADPDSSPSSSTSSSTTSAARARSTTPSAGRRSSAARRSTSSARTSTTPARTRSTTASARRWSPAAWASRA